MGKKSKTHGFMGPLQSLQQRMAGAGFQRGPVPLWLMVGANTGVRTTVGWWGGLP